MLHIRFYGLYWDNLLLAIRWLSSIFKYAFWKPSFCSVLEYIPYCVCMHTLKIIDLDQKNRQGDNFKCEDMESYSSADLDNGATQEIYSTNNCSKKLRVRHSEFRFSLRAEIMTWIQAFNYVLAFDWDWKLHPPPPPV